MDHTALLYTIKSFFVIIETNLKLFVLFGVFMEKLAQSVSQPVSQSVSQSLSQPVNQSVSQSVSQPASQ